MIEYRKAVENDRASIEALFIEMLQTIYHTDDVTEELAESICRMYLTHPGVDVAGILQRIS